MKIVRALNWKYALGELAIVIVGILLAVQIDRWNEARRDAARAADYLERLEVDLRADSVALVDLMEERRFRTEFADSLLRAFERPEPPAYIGGLLQSARGVEFFEPRVATYEELVSTGQLTLIEDRTLRDGLIQYHEVENGDWLRAWSDHLRLTHWEEFANSLSLHVDLRQLGEGGTPAADPATLFMTSWDAFRTDPRILSASQNVWSVSEATIGNYGARLDFTRRLLERVRAGREGRPAAYPGGP